tara:strand:+ start:1516 stop:2427 length:912 start_codon:yes stop_codon:yes gene_type:complete
MKGEKSRGAFGAPKAIFRKIDRDLDLKGVIVSGTNSVLHTDKNQCKSIFIGHGTGDKKYGGSFNTLETYDYHFISGPKHLSKIKDVGIEIPEEKLIKIGYPKFDDYVNQKVNKEKYYNYLGMKDRSRKNILYAPTWEWGDGTLHKYGKKFCQEISKDFNLIIRPHYHDRKHIRKMKSWTKKTGLEHIYFSNPANIINSNSINDFFVSDLMISDTSSIIYEYLITKKPIIIANNNYQDLHNMPDKMNVLKIAKKYDGDDIVSLINDSLNEDSLSDYDQLLNNCFYFNDGKSSERAADFIFSLKN